MIVILVGPPGAGKTKQGQLLSTREHTAWISAGAILRDLNDPDINAIMARGDMLDDNLTANIMAEKIASIPKDRVVILDGFPRRLNQARLLVEFASKQQRQIEALIHITIPREESLRRLQERGRPDDSKESVAHRLDVYHDTIMPVIQFFEQQGLHVYEVNGNRPVEVVFHDIDTIVNDVYQSQNTPRN